MKPAVFIVLLIAIFAAVSSGHSRAATPYPDAANARFSVTVSGEGPDVILIPGLASSGAVWDGTVAHFKGKYRLHVVNLSGFAGEPAGANAQGEVLAPVIEALDSYIDTNHLQKPVVVGHSLGGLAGLMLAKAHPEDLSQLVVVDAFPFIGVIFGAGSVEAIRPQAEAFRAGIISASPEAFEAQQRGTARGMTTGSADLVVKWSVASDRQVLAQSMYDDMTTDLRGDLAGIATPTLVLYPWHPASGMAAENVDGFYRGAYAPMPNVTLKRVDNSLHFIMLDQPETFAAALETVLK